MSSQDSRPMAMHRSPVHQIPEDVSPVSSMSADDHAATHRAPLLDETGPTSLGQHEEISPIARQRVVPNDLSSSARGVHPEPAQNVQPTVQGSDLTEDSLQTPDPEAHGHAGAGEGE
jgi:hypothetical protein